MYIYTPTICTTYTTKTMDNNLTIMSMTIPQTQTQTSQQIYQNTPPPPPPSQHKAVVVVAPLPAQGHMNQLLQLSRLVAGRGIPVHFVGAAPHNRQATRRAHGWDPLSTPNLTFHDFRIPPFPSPSPLTPGGGDGEASNFPSHLLPAFRAASRHLRRPVAGLLRRLSAASGRLVVVHDSLMASAVQDAPALPNAECFTFHSVSAFAILLFYCDAAAEPISSAGFKAVPVGVPSLEGCMTAEMMEFIAGQYEFNRRNSGNLYNTSSAIESPFVHSLSKLLPNKRHWAVGPFNVPSPSSSRSDSKKRHACLEWLDRQGLGSVVYVSFGTTTTLGEEQVREIGLGLKESGHKFLWVVREADRGDGETKEEEEEEVSESEERGVVVREWAPQPEILAHRAVGGFVSHCGWNSCLEGISAGVPIGAWPMHSDQPRNAVLLTEVLGVGVPVREWRDRADVARAGAVAEGVNRLMGAAEVRRRAAELGGVVRQSVAAAAAKDGGGGGSKELEAFISHITR